MKLDSGKAMAVLAFGAFVAAAMFQMYLKGTTFRGRKTHCERARRETRTASCSEAVQARDGVSVCRRQRSFLY